MAHFLVSAIPVASKLAGLEHRVLNGELAELQPFGEALTFSLRNARIQPDGRAVWEEEDYCSPPLREEREAVLDAYFTEIEVERVEEGKGWERIRDLPRLFAVC